MHASKPITVILGDLRVFDREKAAILRQRVQEALDDPCSAILADQVLELCPIALQSGTALSLCFDALSCAEPVSTSAESALADLRAHHAERMKAAKRGV